LSADAAKVAEGVALVFIILLVAALNVLRAMLTVHFANQGRTSAYLGFGTAFKRAVARPGNTIVAGITSLALVWVANVVTFIPVVGFAIGGFFLQVALGSLWAQVYRLGR